MFEPNEILKTLTGRGLVSAEGCESVRVRYRVVIERREGGELLHGVAQEVGFLAGRLHAGAVLGELGAGRPHGPRRGRDLGELALKPAEGIEELSQMATVLALECDLAQGYHFGRPAPEADVERMLQEDASLKLGLVSPDSNPPSGAGDAVEFPKPAPSHAS